MSRIVSQGEGGIFKDYYVDQIVAAEKAILPRNWDILSSNDSNNTVTLISSMESLMVQKQQQQQQNEQQQNEQVGNDPKFAYAFVLWTNENENNMNNEEEGDDPSTSASSTSTLGPYIANILIATKLLKQWGSKADVVLLIRGDVNHENTTSLLTIQQQQMLQRLDIQISFIPMETWFLSSSSSSSSSSSLYFEKMFLKFHVWNLTQYDRVLYLDSDVMPLHNLDYLMEHSWFGEVLAPTVVMAGWLQPATGGFFVLTPNTTDFHQLQTLIRQRQNSQQPFNVIQGWGHAIEMPDQWETNVLSNQSSQTNWTFFGAQYDQGLLYHYAKYVLQNMTQIQATKVVNYHATTIQQEWTLTDQLWRFRHPSKLQLPFWPDNCQRMMMGHGRTIVDYNNHNQVSNFQCVAPYSDWSHFTGITKPWKQSSSSKLSAPVPPTSVWQYNLHATNAVELWWKTLKDLYRHDGMDITQLLTVEQLSGTVIPSWLRPLVDPSSNNQNITRSTSKHILTSPNALLRTNHSELGEWNPTTYSTFVSLSPPKSRFAYVFMIWNCQPEPTIPGYRPYLANMMISAKLLHERFGSQSDVVAMIKLKYKSNYTRLRPEDESMLQRYNIRIIYLPKTPGGQGLNGTGISDMMNKFMVWNLTEYQRILYLDSDVMPLTNLDYLFHLSVQGILCPTIVVAGYLQPANGGFVVLAPNTTDFDNLQHIIHNVMPRSFRQFDPVHGFGHSITPPDRWETNRKRKHGTNWTFYAAHTDQGLLYHYPKYIQKSLTNIFARKIVNFGADENGNIRVEREWNTTSPETSLFANVSQTMFQYYPGNCHKVTGKFGPDSPDWPGCVPPYNHYHHFTGGDKPWLDPPSRNVWVKNRTAFSSTQLWWQMIREIRDNDGVDVSILGLKLNITMAKKRKNRLSNA